MSIWGILRNIGLIISFFKTISATVSGVATTKQMPEKDQIKKLLDDAEALLRSGAIDVPGVDEEAIAQALDQIEEHVCK